MKLDFVFSFVPIVVNQQLDKSKLITNNLIIYEDSINFLRYKFDEKWIGC